MLPQKQIEPFSIKLTCKTLNPRPGQSHTGPVHVGVPTLSSSFRTCHVQHVCRPNKSWSSNHELTAGVSAAVSVSCGQQPSFWLGPSPASYKHMQNSQQHVAVFSILPGLPEFSHGINFAMEVEMFGEAKELIPLLSLGTNCLWSCRQVSSSAVHTGDTSDDVHVSGLDCCTEVDCLDYGCWLRFHRLIWCPGDTEGSLHVLRRALSHAASSYHF